MTSFLYVCLFLLVVPIQTTFLEYVSPWGVKPDLCLVATCLVGFLGGQVRGFGVGMGLGFVQEIFSAGSVGLNMIVKGLAGLVSGTAAKTLSNTTPPAIFLPTLVLSFACGLVSLISARPKVDGVLLIHDFQFILLPQAIFNAVMAFSVTWVLDRYRLFGSTFATSTIH